LCPSCGHPCQNQMTQAASAASGVQLEVHAPCS
jgi:hypothetical protein